MTEQATANTQSRAAAAPNERARGDEHGAQYPDWGYAGLGLPTLSVARTLYSDDLARLTGLLRQLRDGAGLTQVELAKQLGRPQSYVSKYESGQRRLDLLEVREICLALGSTLTVLAEAFERSP